jgi:hypothetical protein
MSPRLPFLAPVLILLSSSAAAGTWYVRREAGAGSDGLTWGTAFQRVQDALAVAQPGDQVWVARGLYRPGEFSSPRTVSFQLPPGVGVYGGFLGGETSLSQRDWAANETILSGDLHLDDAPGFANRSDNCYHVVSMLPASGQPGSTLDGFTVRGGQADTAPATAGGGILIVLPNPALLVHLSIRDNLAIVGGGVSCDSGDLHLRDSEVRGNRAHDAGGIFVIDGFLELQNSLVQGNVATGPALWTNGTGGILLQDSSSQFLQCTIALNHGAGTGGVSSCCGFQASSFFNSILWGNTGSTGTTATDQVEFFTQQYELATDIEGDPAHLDLDPIFVDPLGPDGIAGSGDEDFHLSCVSPLIDRGDNSGVPVGMLFDGHARRLDDPATPDTGSGTAPIVDLGPYEFSCGCTNVQSYCSALPNSTGSAAAIGWSGSTSLFANSFTLLASGAPPLKSGLFFYGATQVNLPWGDGIRCVGGSLQRLAVLQTDAAGSASFPLDFTLPPASSGPHAILPGASWNFQFLFRDPAGGPAGWNTTDALGASFCP